ncbi:MAG TPA: hypothetical protein VGA01_07315 [Candidatus Binatia bacterium]
MKRPTSGKEILRSALAQNHLAALDLPLSNLEFINSDDNKFVRVCRNVNGVKSAFSAGYGPMAIA